MRFAFLISVLLLAGVARAHEDDGNVMKRDGNVIRPKAVKDPHVSDAMREAMGGDPQASVVMTSDPQGMDRIEGKCESKTKDVISVTIPCRDLELILKNGDKTVEKTELDPRGGFLFEKLSPNKTYTLLVRKKTSTHTTRMDGMRTGRIYTFQMDEIK